MEIFEELNDENFEAFAINNYRNSKCLCLEDFKEDIARFKYVLRILRKYGGGKDTNFRLLLNHITIIYNVFNIRAAHRMMNYKIDDNLLPALKTCLMYLSLLKESDMREVDIDIKVATILKDI